MRRALAVFFLLIVGVFGVFALLPDAHSKTITTFVASPAPVEKAAPQPDASAIEPFKAEPAKEPTINAALESAFPLNPLEVASNYGVEDAPVISSKASAAHGDFKQDGRVTSAPMNVPFQAGGMYRFEDRAGSWHYLPAGYYPSQYFAVIDGEPVFREIGNEKKPFHDAPVQASVPTYAAPSSSPCGPNGCNVQSYRRGRGW